jgi:hypothetical protein
MVELGDTRSTACSRGSHTLITEEKRKVKTMRHGSLFRYATGSNNRRALLFRDALRPREALVLPSRGLAGGLARHLKLCVSGLGVRTVLNSADYLLVPTF